MLVKDRGLLRCREGPGSPPLRQPRCWPRCPSLDPPPMKQGPHVYRGGDILPVPLSFLPIINPNRSEKPSAGCVRNISDWGVGRIAPHFRPVVSRDTVQNMRQDSDGQPHVTAWDRPGRAASLKEDSWGEERLFSTTAELLSLDLRFYVPRLLHPQHLLQLWLVQ